MRILHLPILITILTCSFFSLKSQSSLWGVTTNGGNGAGSILGIPTGSTAASSQFNLTDNSGSGPLTAKLLEYNGKLYGMTNAGGANGLGVIFEYDPVANTYTKKIDFTGTAGSAPGGNPNGSLIRATSNGKFYGTTRIGGASNFGVLFEYVLATNTYSKIVDFTGTTGAHMGSQPYTALLEASDGKLYGATSTGGSGTNLGTIFQFDPATNTHSLLTSFTGATGLVQGSGARTPLIEGPIGKLHGCTTTGGTNNVGVIFEYDINANTYTKLVDFSTANGTGPLGSLLSASNGKLYGTTAAGGGSVFGVIYQYDLISTTYSLMSSPTTSVDGSGLYCSLMQAANGKLYGTARLGGVNNGGTIFEYDIPSNTYTKKIDLATTTGSICQSSLIQFSGNNKLYGMTLSGGSAAAGVIFEYDITTNTYTKKIDFNASTGGQPNGVMAMAPNGKLYGTAAQGGGSGSAGVIYEYDYLANAYTQKVAFLTAATARYPYGGLALANNAKFYGLASAGGSSGVGSIYEYVVASAAITKMIDFNVTNGSTPYGTMVLASNGNLYGLTSAGGTNSLGVLFEYNVATAVYTDKVDLTAAGGSSPFGSLVIATNGKAYGLTSAGGANGVGALFEYNITTSTYTKKIDLTTVNGSVPYGSLVQANGNFLYGMTSQGGANNLGVIFEYDITNGTYAKKIDLTAANGSAPYGSLVKAANGKLYAFTTSGGANGVGAMFEYDPVAITYTKKMDLSATTGGAPGYSQLLEICTLPVAAGAITSTANALCQSAAGALNYSIAALPNATSYTWTIPAGATITGSNTNNPNINFSGVAVGVYTVSVAGVNICGTGTLSAKSITINALPTLSVNSGTICSGSSFTISPTGASTYTFAGGSAIVSPTSNASYTVIGTDGNGCVSSGPVTSSVTVNSVPSITVNSGSICAGGSFIIIPAGGSTYTISGGSFTVSPGATTSYSVTGTGANGCVSTASAISNVTVNSVPVLSVNSGSFCSGQSFTITPSGAGSYSITGGSFVVSPAANTNYSVTGTSTAGCAASNTAVASVTINTTPTVAATSGTICSGLSFTIPISGASVYTITGGSAVVSPTVTTSYSVTGTSSAGCVSANTAVATVSVYITPTVTALNYTVCSGNSVTITPGNASTYTITGGTFTVTPAATTSYSITGTSTAGCVSSNTAVSTVTVYTTPTVSVLSGTLCSGKSYTISPAGANTYTITGGAFTVTPAATTSYSITGTSTAGCVALNTAVATVSVYATPTITAANYSICSGNSVIIVPGGGAGTYTITGGTFTVSPSATTSYSITGTSTAGCISATNAVSMVSVNITPTLSVNSGSLCSGSVFTISPSGAGTGGTYSVTGNSFTVSPASSTSYTATGTSSAGCIAPAPVISTVTVYITPTISVNSGTICSGNSFTVLPSGGSAGVAYTITGNSFTMNPTVTTTYSVTGTSTAGCVSGVVVSTLVVNATPTITVNSGSICAGSSFTIVPGGAGSGTYAVTGNTLIVSPSITTSYSVTGTSTAGCVSSTPAVSAVVVNTVPVIAIASPSAICNGHTATLTASGGSTYSWTPSASGATITVSPAANTGYSVTGTSAAGCSATATASLIVNAIPSINVASGAVCPGNSFTLVPGGAVTYTITGGSAIVTPASTTSYSISGTDVNGCTSTLSAVATVTVSAILPVVITGTNTICSGHSATLTAGGASTYSWATGAGTSTLVVSPIVNTTYTVTGLSGSCSNTAIFTLTVNASPTVQVTQSSTLICLGESVTLTASGAASYIWNNGNILAQIVATPSTSTAQSYTVVGTGANGCSGTAVIIQNVNNCLGLTALNKNEILFNVYPNPNNGEFNVEVPKQMEIKILNNIGQVILTQQLENGTNTISLKEQAKGIYFIQAVSNGQVKTARIAVQ